MNDLTPFYNQLLTLVSIDTILLFIGIIGFSIVFRGLIKYGLIRFIKLIANKKAPQLMVEMETFNVFKSAISLAPILVIYVGSKYFLVMDVDYKQFILNIIQILLIINFLRLISNITSLLTSKITKTKRINAALIRTFNQVFKILLFSIGTITVISVFLNKSPIIIFSSMGALSAILLLVFKDSLLGLVASIQVSLLGIVKEGDWIEMKKYNADGTILDINLSSIRVQNWDKTITTIPTYALVSEPVKNWQGMEEAKARRIKRCIYIDIDSIKICSKEDVNALNKVNHLSEYIEKTSIEINESNASIKNKTAQANIRALTNVGLFRQYIVNYIHQHPSINQDTTILIRQLKPSEFGLPIEVYCFTITTDWVAYEAIQSDIFDHLLSIISMFDLRVFQLKTPV